MPYTRLQHVHVHVSSTDALGLGVAFMHRSWVGIFSISTVFLLLCVFCGSEQGMSIYRNTVWFIRGLSEYTRSVLHVL